jgi:hypothetical protein
MQPSGRWSSAMERISGGVDYSGFGSWTWWWRPWWSAWR